MKIGCYRMGALGDCLATTAALRGLKAKYPDCWIRYVTHPGSIPILTHNRFIDEIATAGGKDEEMRVNFVYPAFSGMDGKPFPKHIVRIFSDCAGVDEVRMEYTLTPDEILTGEDLREAGPYVTFHVKTGWSQYKDWYIDRWEKVADAVRKMGYTTIQIGHVSDYVLPGAVDFRTSGESGLRKMMAMIRCAASHVGVDSLPNHASAAFGVPAVILFGSTSPHGFGYEQNVNIWKGFDCSPCYRQYALSMGAEGPCPNGRRCMDAITADEVVAAVEGQLKRSKE